MSHTPIRPSDVPTVIKRALTYHELLRKLGFPADSIYFRVYPAGDVQVTLREQGLEFNIGAGRVDSSSIPRGFAVNAAVAEIWARAVEGWNSDAWTEAERLQVMADSKVDHQLVEMAHKIALKGFKLPGQKEVRA